MAYVYRHIRLDKNEVFYIGIGNDKPQNEGKYVRAYQKANRSNHWKNITNNTLYQVDILFDSLTFEEAVKKEIELIKFYGRRDLGFGTLINLTDGGEGQPGHRKSAESIAKLKATKKAKGWRMSEEQKLQISKFHTGRKHSLEVCAKISAKNLGQKRTPEQLANIATAVRKVWLGRKHTEESKNKMSASLKGRIGTSRKLVLDLSTGIYYDSATEAACIIGMKTSCLTRMLSGERRNKTNLMYV